MISKNSTNTDTIFYHVRSGDNLSKIIRRYHGAVTAQQRDEIINQIRIDNPHVSNPNKIYPDQLLQLNIPPQHCTASSHSKTTLNVNKKHIKPLQQKWQNSTAKEKKLLSTLTPIMLGTGSASMTMLNKTFTANTPLLTEIAKNYDEYKLGTITRGQYDYRRKSLISKIKSRLGPLQKILSGKRSQSEVLRISKTKGRAPTQNITRQIGRMNRLAKHAARGGVVLSAVSLGLACNEIANTNDSHKKNEILVESIGGLLGGVAAGVAIMLIFTPVGWVAALAVGIAGATGGYVSGKVAKNLYTTNLKQFNIAEATKVTQLCKT